MASDHIPAGPELDAAVARAMGRTRGVFSGQLGKWNTDPDPYSADTPEGYAAMRDCLEWLGKEGWRAVMKDRLVLGHLVILTKFDPPAKAVGVAPGLPEAVCRALLESEGSEAMIDDGTIAGDGWIVAQRLQCRIAELEAENAKLRAERDDAYCAGYNAGHEARCDD